MNNMHKLVHKVVITRAVRIEYMTEHNIYRESYMRSYV